MFEFGKDQKDQSGSTAKGKHLDQKTQNGMAGYIQEAGYQEFQKPGHIDKHPE